MALDKEKMSKLLQVLQKKGNSVQGSTEAVEAGGLKKKMKKRKKKKKHDFKDEDISLPANVGGAGY